MAVMSRMTKEGIVDMVAVARFVAGDADVPLTPLERRVAIHAARAAGIAIDTIAKRCRVHDRKIKEVLAEPVPVDSHRRPITLNVRL